MPKYNLDALEDKEFERLCQSLTLDFIGSGVKIYGAGPDGAREASFEGKSSKFPSEKECWKGKWIIQVKFHDIGRIGQDKARAKILKELDKELITVTQKYDYDCDNYILMTNVSLSAVHKTGTKDKIDNNIIPKYQDKIKNIRVLGAEEIERLLDNNSDIRKSYLNLLTPSDIIAKHLKQDNKFNEDLEKTIKLYCTRCYRYEKYAKLDDAGDVDEKPIKLQQVFIDLDIKSPRVSYKSHQLLNSPNWLLDSIKDDNRTSALSYLLDDSILGLILVGGPGEGKSTLAQYTAQIYRANLIGKLDELRLNKSLFEINTPWLPFRVLLKEYAQWISSSENSSNLFDYLRIQINEGSPKKLNSNDIYEIIQYNPILLILDGLDEVPGKEIRSKVLEEIKLFVDQVINVLKGNLRVIATTRPHGYSEEFPPENYLHLTIDSLPPEKALSYVKLWTIAREIEPKQSKRIQSTFNRCLDDEVVKVITQTTLQVTILLVIIRGNNTLPKQREELFESYMDVTYRRESNKGHELLITEKNRIYGIHKYIAYILHTRAENDETAALMDMDEFKDKIREYTIYSEGLYLLNKEKLDAKVNEIIREASQRLVLIESPYKGKVGFGLTSIREFFTAAHLVDTTKDTQEKYARFESIAKSHYWRNVALFFAGRVGRKYEGEIPSIVDVCRKIDRSREDKFIKRGAKLVMEIVDDKVFRIPYHEGGAIEYGITLIENRNYVNKEFISKLKNLPEEYKQIILFPLITEKLKNVTPENLQPYIDIYEELFGVSITLENAIKKVFNNSERDKLWAFSKTIKNNIIEPWVIDLFEELIQTNSIQRITFNLEDCYFNLKHLFKFPISIKLRATIAAAFIKLASMDVSSIFNYNNKKIETVQKLSIIKPEGEIEENALLFWSICQLLVLFSIAEKENRIMLNLPVLTNPNAIKIIEKNKKHFKKFCKVYSNVEEPLIQCIVLICEFILDPYNRDIYEAIFKKLQNETKEISWLKEIVATLLGLKPVAETNIFKEHESLLAIYDHYDSEIQYNEDIKEFNKLMDKLDGNSYLNFLFWARSNYNDKIKEFIDIDCFDIVYKWPQSRELPTNSFKLFSDILLYENLELYKINIELALDELKRGKRKLNITSELVFYEWGTSDKKQEAIVANQLKYLFEEFLSNYDYLLGPTHTQLSILYATVLNANIIEEKHIYELNKLSKASKLPFDYLYRRSKNVIWPQLLDMYKNSDDNEIKRFTAVSLTGAFKRDSLLSKDEDIWLGELFWDLSKDKNDIWRHNYIIGMSKCRLRWKENYNEYFEAIKESKSDDLQFVWSNLIRNAQYVDNEDLRALYDLIMSILESENVFTENIQSAALYRLNEIISDLEPEGIDEKSLNLPLDRTRLEMH